jgi:hypothetical protein
MMLSLPTNTVLAMTFIDQFSDLETDHFAKTGSGQTQGKLAKT